jgi:uracil-DNA glycosylase family 4
MGRNDELRELFDLARRAMECQADLGHREIIFEAGMKKQKPIDALPAAPTAAATSLFEETESHMPAPEFAGLDDHRAAICNCHKCPLGDTRTKFVYGVGNPQARIMFIGEAPGRDEDLQGEPFVGRAGKLLDKILAAILKCRPPNNRDPQPDEMHLCIPYLKEQIRLIHPQMICALGRIAAHGLLETTTPLGRLRKIWHRFENTPLLVTYHPAALLRFPEYKRDTWEDMKLLKAEHDRINAA